MTQRSRNQIKKATEWNLYKPISEFFKIVRDFSIIPDNEFETIEIGIFDQKAILATNINDKLCLTLKQTADYVNIKKHNLEVQFQRHKNELKEDFDYLYNHSQNVSTLYFPLRGILKLLKWTHSGFADRFYDNIVDYICNMFPPIKKSRYQQFRSFILKRDNYTCVRCGKPAKSINHDFSQTYTPQLKYDPESTVTMCYECHEAVDSDAKRWFEN